MIRLDVAGKERFVLRADVPMRVEVFMDRGVLMATVYRGTKDVPEQEPVGGFDGWLDEADLVTWRVP